MIRGFQKTKNKNKNKKTTKTPKTNKKSNRQKNDELTEFNALLWYAWSSTLKCSYKIMMVVDAYPTAFA